jgi:hypothetical protein
MKKLNLVSRNINHSINNILLGNGSKNIYRGRNPYGDKDRDGVLNAYDCRPNDYNRQGIFSSARKTISNVVGKITSSNLAKSISNVGAGIGNVLSGKSYDTPSISNTGTISYPGQSITPAKSTPAGMTAVQTTSGTVYVPIPQAVTPKPGGGGSSGGSSQGGTSLVVSGGQVQGYDTGTQSIQVQQPSILSPSTSKNNLGLGSVKTGTVNLGAVTSNVKTRKELEHNLAMEKKLQEDTEKARLKISGAGQTLFELFTPNFNKKYEQPMSEASFFAKTGKMPTYLDYQKEGYYEQAGEKKLEMISSTQQNIINQMSKVEANKISNELVEKAKKQIGEKQKELQERVNSGKSVYKAQKELETFIENKNKDLDAEFKIKHSNVMTNYIKNATDLTSKEAEKISKEVTKQVRNRDLPGQLLSSALVGAGISAITILAPPVGATIATVGGITAATSAPEIVSYAKEDPFGFTANLAAGITGGYIGSTITGNLIKSYNTNANKINSLAQKNKLTAKDIDATYSESVSKGTFLGKDIDGNKLYSVNSEGITKFVNKKTGVVLDKSISFSSARVVANSGDDASRAVINSNTISLRASGIKYDAVGNKLIIKGDLSRAVGKATSVPIAKDISKGYGSADISVGKIKIKGSESIGNINLQAKARLNTKPVYSSTSNFLSKMLGKPYREVKLTKAGKISGVEKMFETRAVTDITKDYTNAGKRLLKNLKSIRDISTDYSKIFKPKGIKYSLSDLDVTPSNLNVGNSFQNLLIGTSSKQFVKSATASQLRAQALALAREQTPLIVKQFNAKIPTAKVIPLTSSTIKLSNVNNILIPLSKTKLIESNYPTIVGGTKQKNLIGGITGNMIYESDYDMQVPTKTKSKLYYEYTQPQYKSNVAVNNFLVPLTKKYTSAQQRTKIDSKIKTPNIDSLFFSSNLIQIAQPRLDIKQKYQIKQITYKPTTYVPPRFNFNFTPIPPSYRLPKPPKKSYGWYYPTKSSKTKTQKKAYAPSLAAVMLNIKAGKGFKTKKSYSGLEIRPLLYESKDLYDKNYLKRVNKMFIGGY